MFKVLLFVLIVHTVLAAWSFWITVGGIFKKHPIESILFYILGLVLNCVLVYIYTTKLIFMYEFVLWVLEQ